MKTKIQTIIVEIGVVLAMLLTVAVAVGLYYLSFDVSLVNPTLTYMRVPVLIMAWSFLACLLAALIIALLLLESIRRDKIFEPGSVRKLKAIGNCALVAIIPLVALLIYTRAEVAGSITNIYVTLGIFAMLVVAVFFFLIAALFQQAVDYKQEVDLTV
ncbi:MAG: DUF2975 domain-containing protein [Anaerolineaceae bacterium]|nr:DUF2975 domain-containing protein [Anaerolineaceae bacterium]